MNECKLENFKIERLLFLYTSAYIYIFSVFLVKNKEIIHNYNSGIELMKNLSKIILKSCLLMLYCMNFIIAKDSYKNWKMIFINIENLNFKIDEIVSNFKFLGKTS